MAIGKKENGKMHVLSELLPSSMQDSLVCVPVGHVFQFQQKLDLTTGGSWQVDDRVLSPVDEYLLNLPPYNPLTLSVGRGPTSIWSRGLAINTALYACRVSGPPSADNRKEVCEKLLCPHIRNWSPVWSNYPGLGVPRIITNYGEPEEGN